jgi:hypothetical protein
LAGAAFFVAAFFTVFLTGVAFLTGFLGMSRTLCRLALCCQFRHVAIYSGLII